MSNEKHIAARNYVTQTDTNTNRYNNHGTYMSRRLRRRIVVERLSKPCATNNSFNCTKSKFEKDLYKITKTEILKTRAKH